MKKLDKSTNEELKKKGGLLKNAKIICTISSNDHQAELKKITSMSIEEYFENYATAEEKEQYSQLLKETNKDSNTAGAILSGAIAMGGIGGFSARGLSGAHEKIAKEIKKREQEGFLIQDSEL